MVNKAERSGEMWTVAFAYTRPPEALTQGGRVIGKPARLRTQRRNGGQKAESTMNISLTSCYKWEQESKRKSELLTWGVNRQKIIRTEVPGGSISPL